MFDKYLIKIFLGPVFLATYSIPQQITGKLTVLSKGFSAFLLTFLSALSPFYQDTLREAAIQNGFKSPYDTYISFDKEKSMLGEKLFNDSI